MSASANDKFMKAGAGTVTTLSAPGKALSATSITVGSTTNYPTDTGIVFAIRQVDVNGELVAGTYTEWAGTVTSGTTLSMDAAPVYGSDQVYPAGSTTQVYIPLSSSAHNKMVDGLLVSHNQDGTLKTDSVDSTQIKANAVSTPKLASGSVTADKRSGGFYISYIDGSTVGTTGNKSITGVGFRPKMVEFTWAFSSGTEARTAYGVMTSLSQFTVSTYGHNTGTNYSGNYSNACFFVMGGGGGDGFKMSYVSMDTDGFTVNVSVAASPITIRYVAYG